MSVADEGAQLFESGRPPMDKLCGCREDERCDSCTPDSEILFYQSQPWPRVFLSSGPPPPADVLALVDRKGGYWPRVGPDCWNCPGNEPHAWSEMAGSFVEAPRLPTADDVAAAVAADEAWRRQVPAVEGPGLISRCYIGYCPDGEFDPEASSLRVKLTERQPGQFTVRPYEPFLVNCWFRAHPDGHMLYPCTLEEYEAEDD